MRSTPRCSTITASRTASRRCSRSILTRPPIAMSSSSLSVFLDLISQKRVDGVERFAVGGGDPHEPAALDFLVRVRDRRLQTLKRRNTRRHFAVRVKRLLEVATAEFACDRLEMRANPVAARRVGGVGDLDPDDPAVRL